MNLFKRKQPSYLTRVKRGLTKFFLSLKIKTNRFLKYKKPKTVNQEKLDKKLVYSLAPSKIPGFKQIKHLNKFLNPKEKKIINILLLIIFLNLVFLGYSFYKNNLVLTPAHGGEYVEGLISQPKYINPLYSYTSQTNEDIASLVYSSLFKHKEGDLKKDLVKEYQISNDNKTYILTLKDDVKWHDGNDLTAQDVVFTIEAIKNSDYRSNLQSSFKNVEVEAMGDKTVKFVLSKSYVGFLELLTVGILPQHVWTYISPNNANLAEFNLKPIGSGPYKFDSLVKNKSGNIREYKLIANEDYYEKVPYIEKIKFKFFVNINEAISALNKNQIDGLGYLPYDMRKEIVAETSLNFHNINSPKITAIFFNTQKNPYLASEKVRKALNYALDKEQIIAELFGGSAEKINSPIPSYNFAHNPDLKEYSFDVGKAISLLEEKDWKLQEISKAEAEEQRQALEAKKVQEEKAEEEEEENKDEEEVEEVEEIDTDLIPGWEDLSSVASSTALTVEGNWRYRETEDEEREYLIIKLTTINSLENRQVVEKIKTYWENLGVNVVLEYISPANLKTIATEQRDFQALFYGLSLSQEPDIYYFWHSSQIGNGNLNISGYENETIDELLEEARVTFDKQERKEKYKQAQKIINEEVPAIFMYSPYYLYPQDKRVKGFNNTCLVVPQARFSDISSWYIKTKKKLQLK